MIHASRVLACACLCLIASGVLAAAETVNIVSPTVVTVNGTITVQLRLASAEPFNGFQGYLEWDPAKLELTGTTASTLVGNTGAVFTAAPAATTTSVSKRAFFTTAGNITAPSGTLMAWTFQAKASGITQISTRASTLNEDYTKLISADGTVRHPAIGPAVSVNIGNVPTPPNVNAGVDQTIVLPATASLSGQTSSATAISSIAWTTFSGPGTVTFAPNNSPVSTATFSTAGTYVLRLTATNSGGNTSDDVTVTVLPIAAVNTAPVVNAGADQSIVLPAQATLIATATDDGLPTPAAVSYAWSKISGPGTVSFLAPTALTTSAIFSAAGTYVLQLSANDGALTTTDSVTVTVTTTAPTNLAPVVNAGADQSITLPATASLVGIVTDDGLPTPATVATTWSTVSGPGTVTFSAANALTTTATFSAAGTYVLRLSATDGALTTTDTVTVTVTAGGGGNPGDTNGDLVVNVIDLNAVKASFGKSTGDAGFNAGADLNQDGVVNVIDLNLVKANFGRTY